MYKALKLAAIFVFGLIALVGCHSEQYTKYVIHGGPLERSHAKPSEGGYWMNFDSDAATLEVIPVEATNPVRTQHVFVATVKDKDGNPLPWRRVEWLIAKGSVGEIVEVDESGWLSTRGYKVDNDYAVTHTNSVENTITRGNDDPSDDVHIGKGQTYCVITSPIEGDTHVIAYCPAIYDWSKHKVFVVKHWVDCEAKFPPDAQNIVGTPHPLPVKVTRQSTGEPLAGYLVNYKLLSGPAGTFAPGDKSEVSLTTGNDGMATATLNQTTPAEGVNEIDIKVYRPAAITASHQNELIAHQIVHKTWVAPQLAITKTGPELEGVNQNFQYTIVVSNPAKVVDATNVKVTDTLPAGIAYVASNPAAAVSGQALSWSLGTLPAGSSRTITVTVKGTQQGTFTNCAETAADYGLRAKSCTDVTINAPALKLGLTATPECLICELVEYRLDVSNTGKAPAQNVQVTVNLPDGLTTESGRSSVSETISRLDAGRSQPLSFKAKAAKAGQYAAKATATGDGGLKADTPAANTVVRQPILTLAKTGPAQRYINRPATYQITVTNKGDAAARNTKVVDAVPEGAKFVNASDGGTLSGGNVVWQLGQLAPNASKTVTVTLTLTQMGDATNKATVTADCATESGQVSTKVTGIAAILLEMIDVSDPIEVGGNETYEITVTNQGSAEDTNIVVKCTLPAEQAYVSGDGPTRAAANGQVVTFAPLKSLAAGAKVVYKVNVKCTKAADARFRVELTSDQMTAPAQESESTRIYE
ncbi:MAG: hypothetical protein BIFFINMI_03896 [Phycisphaerae bacterium]|nr:hypothetical protein [Phycisphaerae bacterium]